MSIHDKMRSAVRKRPQPPPGPAWAGPCGAGPEGGVTQGMLSRYLSCKERFRVLVIEGLKSAERFNPALEFGNMWHVCEEAHASGHMVTPGNGLGLDTFWKVKLAAYEIDLGKRYPLQRGEIAEWHGKCAALFPLYVEHWSKHPDVTARTPLLAEQTFDVPYYLPSGRTVRLRGKIDSEDAVGGASPGVWVQENKTKSGIDQGKITHQLTYDLQTLIYLIAARHHYDKNGWSKFGPMKGVRYNVVRRASHKTAASMLEKFGVDSRNGRVGEWFARWNVEVSPADVAKFRRECLNPVLENLCDDYEWWAWCKETGRDVFNFVRAEFSKAEYELMRTKAMPEPGGRHFRMPFCGYNPLSEGGFGDVDEYLATGNTVGLRRVDTLFPELEETKPDV